MEVDINSNIDVDPLLKTYPSLQRLSNKDCIRFEDDEDDLSDLYPDNLLFYLMATRSNKVLIVDFRRLRANDSGVGTTTESPEEDGASGTKRKAQTSQIKKPKKLAAPSSKTNARIR